MSPAIVQFAISEPGGGTTSPQTVSLLGTTPGNAVVLIAENQSGAAGGIVWGLPSDGVNTYEVCTGADTNDIPNLTIMSVFFAPKIVGGDVTISVPWTPTGAGNAGFVAFYALEISGVDSYDIGGGDTGQGTQPADAGTFTTRHSGITIGSTIQNNNATGPGPGYTLLTITPGYADAIVYALTTPGPQSPTILLAGPDNWGMVAAAFYLSQSEDAIFFANDA